MLETRLIGHACLEVRTSSIATILDPYLEGSCWAGQLYVTEYMDDWRARILKSRFIIFSHAHDDHYNERFIKKNWDVFKNKKVLIPRFKARFFKKRLLDLGFDEVVELNCSERYQFDDLVITAAINNADMDSSWRFDCVRGGSCVAQTDNLDTDQVAALAAGVDILWFMYGQTGIFPTFMKVPFDKKVELLKKKRVAWQMQMRNLIQRVMPKIALGYASDLYYGYREEANLIELSVCYPSDLNKAMPGDSASMISGDLETSFMPRISRERRVFEALVRDRNDRARFALALHEAESNLSSDELRRVVAGFKDQLQQLLETSLDRFHCEFEVLSLSGEMLEQFEVFSGSKVDCDSSFWMKIYFPAAFLSLLAKGKIEMGAIALWNGAIYFKRLNPDVFETDERVFWRAFRRLNYFD